MKNSTIRLLISLALNLLLIVIAVYVVSIAANKAYSFGTKIFSETAMDSSFNAREVEVTITDAMPAKSLAKLLYNKGLVEDELVTYFQIILSDYKDKFVGGTYVLTTDMKPTAMFEAMCPTEEEESDS